MTREKWAKTGLDSKKWSERLDSNQRPLSPQESPIGGNAIKHGVFNREQFGNVLQAFPCIRGVAGA